MNKDPIPTSAESKEVLQQAEMSIKYIFQQICQFGASDVGEKNRIDKIIEDMKSGIITSEKAIEIATEILHSKNGFLTQYR